MEIALPSDSIRPDLSVDAATRPELKTGSGLELTTLTWSTVTFTIGADTAALGTIDEAGAEAIQRHLSADPRWKLHHRGGVLTAEQRVETDDGWRLTPSGYHAEPTRLWRVAIRFGERATEDPWEDAGLISTSQAGEPEIVVEGIPLSGEQAGRLATAIVVEAPMLAVEIFESAPSNDRSITAESLGTVPVVLPRIDVERVAESGYDPAWLSERHVRTGEPSAQLVGLEPGYSEVTGWLSLTTPGWTWLRLLDATGQPWQDDVVPAWSAERVGWGEGLFYYQSVIPTPEPMGAVTAQLWHQADGGEVVQVLEWGL
ncbi:MAG: hypothetical protein ACI8RZ_002838 [Myxococcota bacterium]